MDPSELLKLNVAELKDYLATVEQLSKDYGYKIIGPKKNKRNKDRHNESRNPRIRKGKKNRLLW